MIKFFRKIRQRLLSENKFSKPASPAGRYLIYAIGEIFLVVVGILIALQVNEWNKERNRVKAEQIIIEQLITDLSKSQYELERERMYNLNEARRYSQVLRGFWKSELPKNIQDYIRGPGSNVYSPVLGTAHSLINSGRLDILSSKKLKNDIVAYVEIVDYTLKDINRYEESYFRKGAELMWDANPNNINSKETLNKRSDDYKSGRNYKNNLNSRPPLVDKVPFRRDLKQLFEDEKFQLANGKLRLYHRNISFRYDELLDITNKLLVDLYKASDRPSNLGELLSNSEHYIVFESVDLEILERTEAFLSDSSKWNKSENSTCDDDSTNESYSLYCAIVKASEEVVGTWEDDPLRPATRVLLFTIGKYENRRVVVNRLEDWNNHPETSFKELKQVLKESKDLIKHQLNEKKIQ